MVSRPRPDAPERAIWRLLERVDRLENATPLASTSVTNGQTRFIGPNSIIIVGSGRVDGTWLVNGNLQGAGVMDWTGLWNMIGDGKIFGDVEVLADGRIVAGNVRIEDGKIYVGVGASQIVIDGATGGITAGGLAIDPATDGGAVTFPGGATISSSGGAVKMWVGTNQVTVSAGLVSLTLGDKSIMITPSQITVNGQTVFNDPVTTNDILEAEGGINANGATLRNQIRFPDLPIAPGSVTSNVWCDPADGRFYQII